MIYLKFPSTLNSSRKFDEESKGDEQVRVNNSGNLSVEYFISYFQLVMNTQTMKAHEAKELIFKRFFNYDPLLRGKTTYSNFEKAYLAFTQ